MKKRYIFLIVLILLIVVPMLEFCAKKQETNQEIQYILRSEEGRELMEAGIMREDPKAFTEEGIIKSYEIDYNSVEHNPMGGFTVTTYMNNDKELYMRFSFDKYRGYLDIVGGSISGKLSDMLEGR
mgnify:FL=1